MRHGMSKSGLNVQSDHRGAIVRALATSVILHERIKTTQKRASLAAPVVERLIMHAKKKDPVNAIREINKVVLDPNASRKLIEVLKVRYKERTSGFTRITKFKNRAGDNAPIVVLELIS